MLLNKTATDEDSLNLSTYEKTCYAYQKTKGKGRLSKSVLGNKKKKERIEKLQAKINRRLLKDRIREEEIDNFTCKIIKITKDRLYYTFSEIKRAYNAFVGDLRTPFEESEFYEAFQRLAGNYLQPAVKYVEPDTLDEVSIIKNGKIITLTFDFINEKKTKGGEPSYIPKKNHYDRMPAVSSKDNTVQKFQTPKSLEERLPQHNSIPDMIEFRKDAAYPYLNSNL